MKTESDKIYLFQKYSFSQVKDCFSTLNIVVIVREILHVHPTEICPFLPLANEKIKVPSTSVVQLRWESLKSKLNLSEAHACVLLRTLCCLSHWNSCFIGSFFMGISVHSPSIWFTVSGRVFLLRIL